MSNTQHNKKKFIVNLKDKLSNMRNKFGREFFHLFRKNYINKELFEELEEKLIISDVGIDTTNKIITNLKTQFHKKTHTKNQIVYNTLKNNLLHILKNVEIPLKTTNKYPFIILIIGVNGVGKTTTIGKLAHVYKQQKKSVMLAAGDTFRAAAIDQLKIFGKKNNVPVISKEYTQDSAAVIFDAVNIAKKNKTEILIVDTAGRLQNKLHLIDELKKIINTIKKIEKNGPHEVILVIDASMGQNVITQTKLFHSAVGLTGLIITKLDGTAKGGIIFSLATQFHIPIRYIGLGEQIQDLNVFNAKDFIDALFH